MKSRIHSDRDWSHLSGFAAASPKAVTMADANRPVLDMSQICEICGRKPEYGKSISHSHRRTNRRWMPNIQNFRATINGGVRKMKVCTSCIKANKVRRAV